jgi:hypothetical protein
MGIIYIHYEKWLKGDETPEQAKKEILKSISTLLEDLGVGNRVEAGLIK